MIRRVQGDYPIKQLSEPTFSENRLMGQWVFIGIWLGMLFGLFFEVLHTFVFEPEINHSLICEILNHDFHNLFVRAFILVLFSAFGLYAQLTTNKQIKANQLLRNNEIKIEKELADRIKIQKRLEKTVHELEEAFNEIKALRGILPICSYCKKIRDDEGYWNQLETYIQKHSEATFSHSICKECAEKYCPHLNDFKQD